MNENRSFASSLWRVVLSLLIIGAVLAATVLVSGSALITVEDITVNRVLAGTYGTPDWRVREMNPLLAQLLTLFYRAVPAVNWYGVLLLALLLAAAAGAVALAARKKGGFVPAAVILCPIVLLLTNAVHSTAVCALCAGTGSLLIMDGLQRRKGGSARTIAGAVLFLFAVMLSFYWGVLLAAAAAVCYLSYAGHESRVKGFALGTAVMAVLALTSYGYATLVYNTPEMAAYRNHYALYERLQHSSLKEEADSLLSAYGIPVFVESDHLNTGHDSGGDHEHAEPDGQRADLAVELPPNAFDAVGWSLNDASLFFTRYGMDTELTDPQTLRILSREARYYSVQPGRLLSELYTTLKKPQFLLLIALLVFTALGAVVTSHGKGLTAMLAVLFALGGHIGALACYYNSFSDIAPFYLLAIVALLYHYDGEDAKAWYRRLLAPRGLRLGASLLALIFFAAGMTGFFYYTSAAPANSNAYVAEAVNFIRPYLAANPDTLFIGDNPNERYKPQTLDAPGRGEDQNLLAGSYDLYSPRAAALLEKYGLTNPLKDSLGREDIAYISMSYSDSAVSLRLADAYGIYAKPPAELLTEPFYSEKIIRLSAYTRQEVEELVETARYEQEQAEAWAQALQEADAKGLIPPAEEDGGPPEAALPQGAPAETKPVPDA
ncbi:MAG: hypothetical protein FWF69_10745 [Firmicutes bacterium]|nr:hypothetical protein [Bacillota bacterium]